MNRRLDSSELDLANALLRSIRKRLEKVANGDPMLLWALRRKIYKELGYDERGKPMHRVKLKKQEWVRQNGRCSLCRKPLPERGSILDRRKAMLGYATANTLCFVRPVTYEHKQNESYRELRK